MRELWKFAFWGLAAAAALTAASYAGSTEAGRDRTRVAIVQIHEMLIPTGVKPPRPLDAAEGRRLAESVRVLTADRERLIARIATLEHSIDDVTGSVARVEKAQQAAPAKEPEPPPPASEARPEEDLTPSISAPATTTPALPSSNVTKTEFGLDLGTANSVEALRVAWAAALRKHGALLGNFRPIVHMRERPRPAGAEFHLVAGPIANAATAARLCASLTSSGSICQPAVYDGQRLAVR